MKLFKSIPIGVHSALEILAAPLLVVAPFALGFGPLAGAISIALGVLLVGLAVSIYGREGQTASVSLTAHAGLDHVIAAVTIAVGLVLLLSGQPAAGTFMAGFGSAHLALSASTRYSRPLGA